MLSVPLGLGVAPDVHGDFRLATIQLSEGRDQIGLFRVAERLYVSTLVIQLWPVLSQ